MALKTSPPGVPGFPDACLPMDASQTAPAIYRPPDLPESATRIQVDETKRHKSMSA